MSRGPNERAARLLNQAEGYLLLDLPARALEILQSRPTWPEMPFESCFLTGEALRALGRYREALRPLEKAAAFRPDHIGLAISLGWCYKRTHRLAQAIAALERANRVHPDEPLLHYNLSCYWSLAGDKGSALHELARAIALDSDLRRLVKDESDFDAIRTDPQFLRLVEDEPAQA